MIYTGLDPGHKNFAVSRISVTKTVAKCKVIEAGMLTNTITQMKGDVRTQMGRYLRDLLPRLEGPIYAERFMARGLKGATAETVNMALGALVVARKKVTLIPAAQWKNAVNKVLDLRMLYKCVGTPPHVVDSTLIAMYCAYKTREEKPFTDVTRKDVLGLIKQIEGVWPSRIRAIRDLSSHLKDLM